MNIAIVIPTIEAGGAEKQAVILAQCLSREHKVTFYVFFGDLPKEEKHLISLSESEVELVSFYGSLPAKTRKLGEELKKRSTEVAFNFLTMCDGVGCLAERRAEVKKIYNGIRSSRLTWWKECLERYCHNHLADGTIFNSYCAAEYFVGRGFKKEKAIVIPNSFPVIFPYLERTDKEEKTVISVGRFDAAKDYETAIKTIAILSKNRKNFQYKIVGYGALEQDIRNWVSKYDIKEITEILINPSNIVELLNEADVFLMTSLYEGTSNALMEAMNASLPVVCTDVGDNGHLVLDNHNGYVHTVGDVVGMAASLEVLLSDHDKRTDFGKAANERLKDNYSVDIFSQRYQALLTTNNRNEEKNSNNRSERPASK